MKNVAKKLYRLAEQATVFINRDDFTCVNGFLIASPSASYSYSVLKLLTGF